MASLLDSGRDISLMSEQAFNRMRPHLREICPPDEDFTIGQANGQPLPILRRVLAPVRVHDQELARQEFWVVPELKAGVILGRDFLHRVRAVMDFWTGPSSATILGASPGVTAREEHIRTALCKPFTPVSYATRGQVHGTPGRILGDHFGGGVAGSHGP
jgi:hypothetical protein